MPKRKCKFTEELQAKYPCFRVGRESWEAECLVCREGTYVSVANKGSLDLEAHVQSMKHKRSALGDAAAPKPPGGFLPAACQPLDANATETPAGFVAALLQGCCDPLAGSPKTPDPVLDALCLQMKPGEAPAPADPLDGVPYCGVVLGTSEAGTPFPVRIRYFDWRRGGVQSRPIGAELPPGQPAPGAAAALAWEALESHGLRERCVAVLAESPNAMLGGDTACALRELLDGALVATECPARLLGNCLQHGADSVELDLQALVWKIYTYVSAYAVCAEPLGDFLPFARREQRRLLRHAATPWLALLPALPRLLQAFPALKSFFLSLSHPPAAIRAFFQDDFSELYLRHVAARAAVLEAQLRALGEDSSPCEVLGALSAVRCALLERRAHGSVSPRVQELLEEQRAAGRAGECDAFCRRARSLDAALLEYLDARAGPFGELLPFQWMQLRAAPTWAEVEASIGFLADRGVFVDDGKCFEQFCRLLAFLQDGAGAGDWDALPTHRKWARFFGSSHGHSELLRVAQVFFAVPSCGADFPGGLFLP